MDTLYGQLESFYLEHRQQLFTCALAVTRCPDRAEDALHDAFQRLFQLRRPPGNLRAYVFRSVRNAAIDSVRRKDGQTQTLNDSIFATEDDPRRAAANEELLRRVEQALPHLTDDERETVVQHLYGELTFREIAEIRDTPLGTVTSWYRRGLQKLREYVEN